MTTPASLKTTPFESFGNQTHGPVLSDDYVHKKFGNFKLKAITKRDATINLKTGFTLTENVSEGRVTGVEGKLSDELKVLVPLNRFFVETEVKRNGELNTHVDAGSVKVAGKSFNIFANLNTNLQLNSLVSRLGVNYFGQHCDSGTRLERSNSGALSLTQRNLIRHGSVLAGLVLNASVPTFKLGKYDALLKYTQGDFDFFLQHFTPAKEADRLRVGKVAAFLVYRWNDQNTLAVQFKRNFENEKIRFVFGGSHKLSPNTTLRAKTDQKLKITANGKWKLNDVLSLSVAAQLNLQRGAGAFDFRKLVPVPFGWQLDFAV